MRDIDRLDTLTVAQTTASKHRTAAIRLRNSI